MVHTYVGGVSPPARWQFGFGKAGRTAGGKVAPTATGRAIAPVVCDFLCLLTDDRHMHESAPDKSDGGPSRGCVHRWTSAGNRPKKSHFVSLFGPPGVIPTCRDLIGKSFHARQIRSDLWPSRASKTPCGTWDPKILISISADCSLSHAAHHGTRAGTRWRYGAAPDSSASSRMVSASISVLPANPAFLNHAFSNRQAVMSVDPHVQPGCCRPASAVGALDTHQVIAGPGETMDGHRVAVGCVLMNVAVGVDRDGRGAVAEVPGLLIRRSSGRFAP